jgi:hypothetical protein
MDPGCKIKSRKGPYEQEKHQKRTIVAREKAGKNPISQRDIRGQCCGSVNIFSVVLILNLITDPDPTRTSLLNMDPDPPDSNLQHC